MIFEDQRKGYVKVQIEKHESQGGNNSVSLTLSETEADPQTKGTQLGYSPLEKGE